MNKQNKNMWILYNLAHKFTKIRSNDGDAWIRVLGFFNLKDDALKHAKKLSQIDDVEIRVAPQNEFRLLMRTVPSVQTRDIETKKYHLLMDLHNKTRQHAREETLSNAENHSVGNIKSHDVHTSEKNVSSSLPPSEDTVKSITTTLRMQNFCAIAIIPDYEFLHNQDKTLDDYERETLNFIASFRNEKYHQKNIKICVQSIMSDWVQKNMPPNGANVYGQKMYSEDQLFTKIPLNTSHLKEQEKQKEFENKMMKDSNFVCWSNMFKQELDARIWNLLDVKDEELLQKIEDWKQQHPCPVEINGAEPMVAFLDYANTEAEMQEKIEKNSEFANYDIGCIVMYEWVRIKNAFSNDVRKTYREKLLNELHQRKEFQKQQVEKLKLTNETFKTIEIQ